MSVGIFKGTWLVLKKDLLIEWRTRARLNALVFFAFATLLLFTFALGPDMEVLTKNAGGYLWLALLFASVLCLGESFRVESENQALDGLRLLPTEPRAIFLGKALGNTILLFSLGLLLIPITIAVYDVKMVGSLWHLILVLLLGCLAISAPGTVYAAIASNARARDVLLPLLLFPVLIPALLASVKASKVIIEGDLMNNLNDWLTLLAGFNTIYWALGFILFPRIIEDD
ncbi:MAG: heme exporter protein CcmB [Myxococcaceae bacterium]|nr:heme exporter protein CcmB [Myxococcaceae bacterium]